MNTVTIYPVPGRLTRHPETGEPVPAQGLTVPRLPYWLRRLASGDVTTSGASTVKFDPGMSPGPTPDNTPGKTTDKRRES